MNNLARNVMTAMTLCSALISGAAEITQDEGTPLSEAARPVTGIYSVEIGRKSVLATYLSPLRYAGTNIAVSGMWSKAMPFSPESAVMEFNGSGWFSDMLNPAATAKMVALGASFDWGMSWRKKLPYDVQLTVGGSVGIEGGAYWLMRNGNNPVQAMACASLSARVSLSRPFRLGRLPVLVRDEVSVPSLGIFFSPEYGESYYEIYLGNRSGLVHCGWWGNNFKIDNLLSVTLDFGRTSAMVGYRFRADTQWANNLNTKIFTHSLVLGVVPGGIGLARKPRREAQEAISSLY